jgi:hypothetical protein
MTRKTGELLKTLALVAFLAGGLVLVRIGALPLWLWGVLTAVTVFMRYAARLDAYTEQLEIGDQGVTRRHGSRMRQQLTEAVRWDELTKVEVLARETGADKQEPLFLLHGPGTRGVAVPGALAQQHDLTGLLQRRLAGFDTAALAQALAADRSGRYVLWERDGA